MRPRTAGIAGRASRIAAIALTTTTLALPAHQVHAGAVIYNSADPTFQTVALGVNEQGHLNFSATPIISINGSGGATGIALRTADGFVDATSPGCLCEGWGVAATLTNGLGDRISGFASIDNGGIGGLTGGSFIATATAATSVVGLQGALGDIGQPLITVTHSYGVSLAPNTFQGNVTIRNNTNSAITDVVYRRAMDWDVPPTEFAEYVTHSGIVANLERIKAGANVGGNVRYASDNGFASVNPLETIRAINPETVNTDFVDNGPNDHGSVFDFAFGTIAAGEQRSFNIFYGAFGSEAAALAAVNILAPNIYSLGQPRLGDEVYVPGGDEDCGLECPVETIVDVSLAADSALAVGGVSGPGNTVGAPTFLFAFGGVGGVEQGLDPTTPILPFVVPTGGFFFEAPIPRRWYDPPFTSGFEYAFTDSIGEFTGVMTPDGFGDLFLSVGGTKIVLADGTEHRFGPGVRSFKLFATDDRFDTADPTVLPTFLDFIGDPATGRLPSGFTMTPLPPNSSVPAPAALLLLAVAIAGLGLRRRMR